jgi:hypothetical protein
MAQQTAVEWLFNWMSSKQYFIGNDLLKAVEQAKAMEKEQVIEAWKLGNLPTLLGRVLTAEEYYNQTYNNEKDN